VVDHTNMLTQAEYQDAGELMCKAWNAGYEVCNWEYKHIRYSALPAIATVYES
jgi:hypothetical protein